MNPANSPAAIALCLTKLAHTHNLSVKIFARDCNSVRSFERVKRKLVTAFAAVTWDDTDEHAEIVAADSFYAALSLIEIALKNWLTRKAAAKQLHKDAMKLAHVMHRTGYLFPHSTFGDCLMVAYSKIKTTSFEDAFRRVIAVAMPVAPVWR